MSILTGSARVTVAALMERIAALESQIAEQAPASARAEQPTFFTRKQIAAGGGFACSAPEPCGKHLRTAKRAQSHGADGHFAAK